MTTRLSVSTWSLSVRTGTAKGLLAEFEKVKGDALDDSLLQ